MKLGDIVKPSDKWIYNQFDLIGGRPEEWEVAHLVKHYREKCFGIITEVKGEEYWVTWFNGCFNTTTWWEKDELTLVKEAQYDEYIFDRD